jgi:hypothetical protein
MEDERGGERRGECKGVGETNGPRELVERREKERWMSKVLDLDSEHSCGTIG